MEPITLNYKSLPGLSEKQISEHYEVLYKGYINKLSEIRQKIEAATGEGAGATYADIRELKLEESFASNAVKLHEAYFLGLGGNGTVTETVSETLAKDFGSYEKWEADFRATGMSARGWAVLYYDWKEGRLRNGLADFHSHGAIWSTTPVLVLDVYEHAYFIDYGTKRKDYIDSWFANINWSRVEKTLAKVGK
jgi:superoxide dismutase, Fe-Mn family